MKIKVAIVMAVAVLIGSLFYFFGPEKNAQVDSVQQPESSHKTGQEKIDLATPQGINEQDPFIVGSKRRLWHELPFSLVKARAEQGDAEAQWMLSQMYDYCLSYSLNQPGTLKGIDQLVELKRTQKAGFERIKKELVERCATVDDGKPIPTEAVTLWVKQSAEQGYMTAKFRNAVLSQEADPKTLLSYVDAIDKTSAPQAVFEMGTLARLIEPNWKDKETAAAFSSGKYAKYAWELAACRSGLDCSQSSSVMYWVCFQGGCGYDNYEQYVMSELVTPAGKKQLEESIRMIQENFLNG